MFLNPQTNNSKPNEEQIEDKILKDKIILYYQFIDILICLILN
jgi:hypothetical protein